MSELNIDPQRLIEYSPVGVYVRAYAPGGGVGSYDIAHLDKASLRAWLLSRGGDNPLAENVVGVLLGHGHLHEVGGSDGQDGVGTGAVADGAG